MLHASCVIQMSSTCGMKTEPHTDRPYSQAEGPVDAEELRQDGSIRQSAQCSFLSDVDNTPFAGCNHKGTETVSTEYMERLILLTSNARSWHASDDETVDLTEPRFESFCMKNVKSP